MTTDPKDQKHESLHRSGGETLERFHARLVNYRASAGATGWVIKSEIVQPIKRKTNEEINRVDFVLVKKKG